LSDSSKDESTSSPETKISKKDKYFIHVMLKINESVDNSVFCIMKEKEEKEPGFARLESHRKNLILNASALPPFGTRASKPTNFYSDFLSKKSLFKAKEFMAHHFIINKTNFNPGHLYLGTLE
jgi:hypothetical protein